MNEVSKKILAAELKRLDRRVDETKDHLIETAESLKRRIDGLIQELRAQQTFNQLGVCQGTAIEVDRLCGELYRLKEERARWRAAIEFAEEESQEVAG